MFSGIVHFFQRHPFLINIATALLIAILVIIIRKIVPKIEDVIARKVADRTKSDLDNRGLDMVAASVSKIVWIVGIYFILESLRPWLPDLLIRYRDGILYVLAVMIIAQFIIRLLQLVLDWYSERFGERLKGQVYNEFGPLFKRLISIVVYTIVVVTILHHFKQNVSSIVVSLGVGSLAVAMAARDSLANMIAGFMIMTDRPFRLGDRILLESGEKGDVYDIGLRSTKILTFDNTLIVVPNQQIINEKVTNLTYPDPQIRIMVEVGVAYGSDLEKAKLILEKICRDHPVVLEDPPPKAYFLNFGDSYLDLRVV